MVTPVAPADSTVDAMRRKVRRLTVSASESSLSTADIDRALNTAISQDFPYAIKLDQMRSVYTFFTEPYRDRYPLDVNYNQGVRAPVYVEGIQASFYKDRQAFNSVWPRFPTKFNQSATTLTGIITGIAQPTNPTQITSAAHGLITGAVITISGVVGMTQLNGNSYTINVIDSNTFSLDAIDNTAFGAYVSGGTWLASSQSFSFTITGPFLSKEVVIGGVDTNGNPISINDNGDGILQLLQPNPVQSKPLQNTNPAIPGMYNRNIGNPGLINPTNIGSVDYVSGLISFTLPPSISLALGTYLTVWVSQYTTGRPLSVMFWNNEFTVRPVPKLIHKIEVETFLTPIQFLLSDDVPILTQWWQYISYIAAMEILRERQDMAGVENLREGFERQEALVLERQGIEELFTPNPTMFNSPIGYSNGPWGNIGSWNG